MTKQAFPALARALAMLEVMSSLSKETQNQARAELAAANELVEAARIVGNHYQACLPLDDALDVLGLKLAAISKLGGRTT